MRTRAGGRARGAGRRSAARRGLGLVLILVCALLVILCVLGLGQHVFSRQVLGSVHRASLGVTCQYAAESACNEALCLIQEAVNDPDARSEVFDRFRRNAWADGGTFAVDVVRPEAMTATGALLASLEPGAGFRLDEVWARVLVRRPLTGLGDESYGTLHLRARVSAALQGGVTRQVDVLREFKVALVSPPYPVGRFTVFAGSARGLIPDNANDRIRIAYLRIRQSWANALEIVGAVQSAPSTTAKQRAVRERFLRYAKATVDLVESKAGPLLVGKDGRPAVAGYDWASRPEPLREDAGGPHYFGDPTVEGRPLIASPDDLTLISVEAELPLAAMALRPQVEPKQGTSDRVWRGYRLVCRAVAKRCRERARRAQQRGVRLAAGQVLLSNRDLAQLRVAAGAVVEAEVDVLQTYHAYQASLWEYTGDQRRCCMQHVEAAFTEEAWKRKAFYRVESAEAFAKLLAQVRPLSGIVRVESPDPIQIDGQSLPPVQGKLVVALAGPCSLSNLRVEDPQVDQLTFVCFRNVALSGAIDASVVLARDGAEPLVDTDPSLRLKGQLISVGRLEARGGAYEGTVVYDETLHCRDGADAVKQTHYYAAIAPTRTAKGVRRR